MPSGATRVWTDAPPSFPTTRAAGRGRSIRRAAPCSTVTRDRVWVSRCGSSFLGYAYLPECLSETARVSLCHEGCSKFPRPHTRPSSARAPPAPQLSAALESNSPPSLQSEHVVSTESPSSPHPPNPACRSLRRAGIHQHRSARRARTRGLARGHAGLDVSRRTLRALRRGPECQLELPVQFERRLEADGCSHI